MLGALGLAADDARLAACCAAYSEFRERPLHRLLSDWKHTLVPVLPVMTAVVALTVLIVVTLVPVALVYRLLRRYELAMM